MKSNNHLEKDIYEQMKMEEKKHDLKVNILTVLGLIGFIIGFAFLMPAIMGLY